MTSVLEAAMLVCFGFSWPINLVKNIKAKTAKSMSIKFIILIILGYVAGISAKLISHNINYVLVIYLLNLAIVSLNIVVYIVNKKKDREVEDTKTQTTVTTRKKTEIESRFSDMNKVAKKNSVVFFGSNYFSSIPFSEFAECYNMEESVYNRSVANKSIDELCDMLDSCVFELAPSKVFINIGEVDLNDSAMELNEFVEKYEWMLYTINANTCADIYIVSVLSGDSASVNVRLRALAAQYGCRYIDITSSLGMPNQALRSFNLMKSYIRTRPMDFLDAMNM